MCFSVFSGKTGNPAEFGDNPASFQMNPAKLGNNPADLGSNPAKLKSNAYSGQVHHTFSKEAYDSSRGEIRDA